MSAAPTFALNDIDASHLPERMDVASSPYQHANDVDVDLDPFRDPSVLEDEMIDYQDDFVNQDDGAQDIAVDDIMDQASTAGHEFDYSMDSFLDQPEEPRDEDDDILYEDDDETEAIPQHLDQDNPDNQPPIDQEVEFVAEDDVVETIDEVFDEDIKQQVDDKSATQAPNPDNSPTPLPTSDTPAHSQEHTDSILPQPDAQSPASRPEWTFPDGEEAEAENLLPEDSEHVPLESIDYHKENDPTLEVLGQDSLLFPQGSAQMTSDTQHEEAQGLSDSQIDPTREIHPVTLVYLEEEMSLFPPLMGDDSSVYFLSDSTLASQPLDKLLAACREILTGTLDHHDELVLDIPGLGLHICEDSKYSTQITLASVLEIYLKLCHNDPDDQPQPLYCHLSSRVSLASQYAYLSSAGDEGKTYAEIVADHADTPDEASIHANDQEYSPEVQETSVDPTEHAMPPSPEAEAQVQTSKANSDLPPAEEDLFGELDESFQAQSDGIQALGQKPSDEDALLGGQDTEPDQNQEDKTDIGIIGDQDQEEPLNQARHEQSPAAVSNSSHTVEAYHDDMDDHGAYDEDAGVEDLFNDTNQDTDTLLNQQGNAEHEDGYGDEELFPKNEDGLDASEQPATLLPEEDDDQLVSTTGGQKLLDNDAGDADFDFLDNEADSGIDSLARQQGPVDPTPPITPSKTKVSKRKAEVDDDLDFLEIGTPELKRRRPS